MLELGPDEKILYEHLNSKKDSQGIVRYEPESIEKELNMVCSEVEKLLEKLYVRGMLVYITRVNKETGQVLKIVQLTQEL